MTAPVEAPVKAPSSPTTFPPEEGVNMADWAGDYLRDLRALSVQKPPLSHGDVPPLPPVNNGDGDNRRPHMTWGQQIWDSAKHIDALRVGGLLALYPQREVKATFKGINAAARSLRYGGRKHGHYAGRAFRGAFRERVRNFDDMTNENRWLVRGVGAVAIAAFGLTILSNTALAPVVLSK